MVGDGVARLDAGEAGGDALPGDIPGQALVVAPHRLADAAPEVAGQRDHGEADADQGPRVGRDEGRRLHRRPEHLAPGPLPAGVVEAGILPRQARRRLRIAGMEDGPDLGADGRAHLVDEIVLEAAGHRRTQTAVPVAHEEAVLVPRVGLGPARPRRGELMHAGVGGAGLLHRRQPHQLEIEVVVGRCGGGHRIVEGQRQLVALALMGRAQGAADALAQPAGEDAVTEVGAVEDEAIHEFCSRVTLSVGFSVAGRGRLFDRVGWRIGGAGPRAALPADISRDGSRGGYFACCQHSAPPEPSSATKT